MVARSKVEGIDYFVVSNGKAQPTLGMGVTCLQSSASGSIPLPAGNLNPSAVPFQPPSVAIPPQPQGNDFAVHSNMDQLVNQWRETAREDGGPPATIASACLPIAGSGMCLEIDSSCFDHFLH